MNIQRRKGLCALLPALMLLAVVWLFVLASPSDRNINDGSSSATRIRQQNGDIHYPVMQYYDSIEVELQMLGPAGLAERYLRLENWVKTQIQAKVNRHGSVHRSPILLVDAGVTRLDWFATGDADKTECTYVYQQAQDKRACSDAIRQVEMFTHFTASPTTAQLLSRTPSQYGGTSNQFDDMGALDQFAYRHYLKQILPPPKDPINSINHTEHPTTWNVGDSWNVSVDMGTIGGFMGTAKLLGYSEDCDGFSDATDTMATSTSTYDDPDADTTNNSTNTTDDNNCTKISFEGIRQLNMDAILENINEPDDFWKRTPKSEFQISVANLTTTLLWDEDRQRIRWAREVDFHNIATTFVIPTMKMTTITSTPSDPV